MLGGQLSSGGLLALRMRFWGSVEVFGGLLAMERLRFSATGLNVPFPQRHGQRTEESESWGAGPCSSPAQHQKRPGLWFLCREWTFFSLLGNYYYSTEEVSVIIVTVKICLVFGGHSS